ncbi:hypothetical protein D3C84_544630 [compost metagenome]
MQAFGQTLGVDVRIARQRDVEVSVASVVDQLETDARLLHLPGLTHLGVVETHEGRRFGGVAEGELLRFANRLAQPVDQGLERISLTF